MLLKKDFTSSTVSVPVLCCCSEEARGVVGLLSVLCSLGVRSLSELLASSELFLLPLLFLRGLSWPLSVTLAFLSRSRGLLVASVASLFPP